LPAQDPRDVQIHPFPQPADNDVVPKLRKPKTSTRADKTKARKSAAATAAVPAAPAATDATEVIACMHCGHVNPLPGGIRPGRTVSCKLCARMFSVEAAAAHVPPPPPEPPPPPPGMTPHRPDTESIDAPTTSGPLIYTPALAPRKKLSRTFRFALGLTITIVVIAIGVGLAVMGPSLYRMHVAAKRNTCAANLKRISAAVDLYAYGNAGAYPDSLGRLMTDQALSPDALICPGGNETPATGATPREQAAKLSRSGHSSYFYVGKGLNKRSGPGSGFAAVVAYEPPGHHGDGIHVLFADGRVAFVLQPQARQLIADLKAGKNPPSPTGF
jgi:prepilin-type processing-associated H-X9-DG protein